MSSLDYLICAFLFIIVTLVFIMSCSFLERLSKLENYLGITYSTESYYIQKGA